MKTSYLPIRLQTAWFLLDAHKVREVIGATPWLRLPRARGAVPGVVAWRARALPVVDLAVFAGLQPIRTSELRSRILIVDAEDSTLALPVDGVSEVALLAPETVGPQHATACDIARGEVEVNGQVMSVVDWDRLWTQLFTDFGPAREGSSSAGTP